MPRIGKYDIWGSLSPVGSKGSPKGELTKTSKEKGKSERRTSGSPLPLSTPGTGLSLQVAERRGPVTLGNLRLPLSSVTILWQRHSLNILLICEMECLNPLFRILPRLLNTVDGGLVQAQHKWMVLVAHSDWLTRWWLAKYSEQPMRNRTASVSVSKQEIILIKAGYSACVVHTNTPLPQRIIVNYVELNYRCINLVHFWCCVTSPDFFSVFVDDRYDKLHYEEGVRGSKHTWEEWKSTWLVELNVIWKLATFMKNLEAGAAFSERTCGWVRSFE